MADADDNVADSWEDDERAVQATTQIKQALKIKSRQQNLDRAVGVVSKPMQSLSLGPTIAKRDESSSEASSSDSEDDRRPQQFKVMQRRHDHNHAHHSKKHTDEDSHLAALEAKQAAYDAARRRILGQAQSSGVVDGAADSAPPPLAKNPDLVATKTKSPSPPLESRVRMRMVPPSSSSRPVRPWMAPAASVPSAHVGYAGYQQMPTPLSHVRVGAPTYAHGAPPNGYNGGVAYGYGCPPHTMNTGAPPMHDPAQIPPLHK